MKISTNKSFIAFVQFIFVIFLAFIVFVVSTKFDEIKIDTSLTDLAPQFAQDPANRKAVDQISSNLEKRIVLLVEHKDKTLVQTAINDLSNQIDALENISIAPDASATLKNIVTALEPFRFNLLTEIQSQQLTKTPQQLADKEIAEQSYQQLFQLNANPRLVDFKLDPLGWHNDLILSYLKNLSITKHINSENTYIVFNIADGKLALAEQQSLHEQLTKIISTTEQKFDVQVFRSGIFFFATEAASESKQDISLITSISMLFVFGLLILVFRHLGLVILPFLSIALGVAFAIAVTQFLFGAIHILTIVFGASLIGVVIDYSLHFFYHQSHQSTADSHESRLFGALFFSLCTSLVGYAALSFSSIITLQKVALFSCCGLLMAWLSVLAIGNVMTKNMAPPRELFLTKIENVLFLLFRCISKPVTLIIFCATLLGSIAIITFAPPVNDDPRLFFNPSPKLLAQETKVGVEVNDFEPGRYLLIKANDENSLQDILRKFRIAVSQTQALNQSEFVSLIDWIPSLEQQQTNYQLQASLYSENGAIAQLNSKLGIHRTVEDNLPTLRAEYLNANNKLLDVQTIQKAVAEVLPPLWLKHQQQELAIILVRKGTNFEELSKLTDKSKHIEYINTLAATTEVLAKQRHSASWLLVIAYCLIGLLLICRFKKLSALWLLAVPLFSSSLIVVLFFVAGNTLNLFHIMALFLVLGLGMDYSIFVKEMRKNLSITHHSIFLSAITSLLSFGLLALSSIPVVSAFGITLLLGNLSNLFSSFIFSEQLSHYEQ